MLQSILSTSSRSDAGNTESEKAGSTREADAGSESPARAEDESGQDPATLDEDVVYGLLGNDRRRACLKLLSQSDTEWAVSDLSEQVAERVADSSTSPDDIYDSVYISMYQNHLPHLDESDVVEYDTDEKTVRVGPAFDDLEQYWSVDQESAESEPAPSRFALTASVLTVLTLGAVWLALPSLSTVVLPSLIALHASALAVELGFGYGS